MKLAAAVGSTLLVQHLMLGEGNFRGYQMQFAICLDVTIRHIPNAMGNLPTMLAQMMAFSIAAADHRCFGEVAEGLCEISV